MEHIAFIYIRLMTPNLQRVWEVLSQVLKGKTLSGGAEESGQTGVYSSVPDEASYGCLHGLCYGVNLTHIGHVSLKPISPRAARYQCSHQLVLGSYGPRTDNFLRQSPAWQHLFNWSWLLMRSKRCCLKLFLFFFFFAFWGNSLDVRILQMK